MESLLTFAQNANPLIFLLVIIGGLVHVLILLLKNTGLIGKIRKTTSDQMDLNTAEIGQLVAIDKKLSTIMGNHLHGLPEMEKSLDRIEANNKEMLRLQNETLLVLTEIKGFIKK